MQDQDAGQAGGGRVEGAITRFGDLWESLWQRVAHLDTLVDDDSTCKEQLVTPQEGQVVRVKVRNALIVIHPTFQEDTDGDEVAIVQGTIFEALYQGSWKRRRSAVRSSVHSCCAKCGCSTCWKPKASTQ